MKTPKASGSQTAADISDALEEQLATLVEFYGQADRTGDLAAMSGHMAKIRGMYRATRAGWDDAVTVAEHMQAVNAKLAERLEASTRHDNLTDRLRCRYPMGPMIDGRPEFGWRDMSGVQDKAYLPSPIMLEAADTITSMQRAMEETAARADRQFAELVAIRAILGLGVGEHEADAVQELATEVHRLRRATGSEAAPRPPATQDAPPTGIDSEGGTPD